MSNVKKITLIAIVMLILQLFMPSIGQIIEAKSNHSGKVDVNKVEQSTDTIKWKVTINAASEENNGSETKVKLSPGQTQQEINNVDDALVETTNDGYIITTPEGKGTYEIDITTSIVEEQAIYRLDTSIKVDDGNFQAFAEVPALKEEVVEEVAEDVNDESTKDETEENTEETTEEEKNNDETEENEQLEDEIIEQSEIENDEQSGEENEETEEVTMQLMATGGPGEYFPDENGVVVETIMDDNSINGHTRSHRLWANGNIVYVAVKSTHILQYMELNGVRSIDSDVYEKLQFINIAEESFNPQEGLQGNTKDSHWTVFAFNLYDLNLPVEGQTPYFIKGIGGGHDVGGFLTFKVPTADMEANKVWVGGTERPEITLQLLAAFGEGEQEVIRSGKVNGSEDPSWTYKWQDVPQYDPYGRPYTFAADEETVPVNYEKSIDGLTVTNTYNPSTIDIPVEKTWIGPAAEEVTVILVVDGVESDKAITLNEANNWSASFENLNVYDDVTGEEVNYSVTEVEIAGYSSEITGTVNDGFVITNTNTATIDIPVEKRWVGAEGEAVTVALYRDGVFTEGTLELGSDNNWSDSFNGLPKYDMETGEEIHYSVQEVEVPEGYDVSYEEENGTIIVINTERYGSLTVEKVDENGEALKGATFELRDMDGNVIGTQTSDEDGMLYFEELVSGEYQLIETKAPEGYTKLERKIDITISSDNLHQTIEVENTRQGWEIPNTGGVGSLGFYGLGLIIMTISGISLFRRRLI